MQAMVPITYDKPRPAGECSFYLVKAPVFLKKDIYKKLSFFCRMGRQPLVGQRPLYCREFTITLSHTRPGRTPLDERSARRRELYLTTQNAHKRQTSLLPAGIEPAIPVVEWLQTHALDRAVKGKNGCKSYNFLVFHSSMYSKLKRRCKFFKQQICVDRF
jgi:hypothetical protein